MPYLYNLMLESGRNGLPIMRHLALEFPEDENVYAIDDEFMTGEALLVAPVFEDYVASREVYLPAGNWYDLYTGKRYESGTHTISLVREHAPVFMHENACVALNLKDGKLCSAVGNKLDGYCELTFLVSGQGEYLFSDDLGNEIAFVWDEKNATVRKNVKDTKVHILRIGKDKIY